MHATSRKLLLVTTAIVETATGVGLLFVPAVVFALLLGSEPAAVDATVVGRIAGAALLAIGIASWMARTAMSTPAQLRFLTGMLVYNVAASMLLAFAGAVLKMTGILLWPAVALHAVLAVCCFTCLRSDSFAEESHRKAVDR